MRDVVSPPLRARLLLPRADLASLIFAAIIRDTQDAGLDDGERFNHFPASPLCSATFVRNGSLYLSDGRGTIAATPLPEIFVAGPFSRPLTSWSPDGVSVMTIGLYPDALRALSGIDPGSIRGRILALDALPPGQFRDLLRNLAVSDDLPSAF